jgi:hypothetical protein
MQRALKIRIVCVCVFALLVGVLGARIASTPTAPDAHAALVAPTGKSYADIAPALRKEYGGGGPSISIYGDPARRQP